MRASRRLAVMASWSSAHSRNRSATSSSGTWSSSPAAWVPASLLNGKNPTQSSWASFDPLEQVVVIGLGLARIADDERRSECGRRFGCPDRPDPIEEPLAVTPPAHALEQRSRNVLQREVEVGHAGGENGLDQRVVERRRVEIEKPGPADPFRHRGHQVDDRSPAARGRTVEPRARSSRSTGRGRTTRGPGRPAPPRGASRSGPPSWSTSARIDSVGARPLFAPERGDGAESAVPIASLGDLDVRPRCRGRRSRQVQQVERRDDRCPDVRGACLPRVTAVGEMATGPAPAGGSDAGTVGRPRSVGEPRRAPPDRPRAGRRPTRRRTARPCTR